MTVEEMTVEEMTVEEMTVEEMTVEEITVEEMTVEEMTGDKMTIFTNFGQNDCRRNDKTKWLFSLTLDKMIVEVMTGDKMTVEEMTGDKMIVEKMTEDKMTVDEMTKWSFKSCRDELAVKPRLPEPIFTTFFQYLLTKDLMGFPE
jgi:hypothetical protein